MNTLDNPSLLTKSSSFQSYSVLVVDDEQSIRRLVSRSCKRMEWHVDEAESGYEAIELLKHNAYQIFIIDVNMPGPSGNDLAKLILEKEEAASILILTGYAELGNAVNAVQSGVCNYIQKNTFGFEELNNYLINAAEYHEQKKQEIEYKLLEETVRKNVELTQQQLQSIFELSSDMMFVVDFSDGNVVHCNPSAEKCLGLNRKEILNQLISHFIASGQEDDWESVISKIETSPFYTGEFEMVTHTGKQIPVEIAFRIVPLDNQRYVSAIARDITERKQHIEQLQATITNTIQLVALTVEKRDPYTAGHQKRVAQLCEAIARKMELSNHEVEGIYLGGLIHDVGKVGIPSSILSKPGKLYKEEFELIKLHPQLGYDIVKDIQFPWPIHEMILQHHERLDGSGYPNRLQSDEIILEAKIMGVADVVEAVSSYRPYRPALGIEKALTIIQEEKGTHFEPKIVDVCCELFHNNAFSFEF